MLARKALDVRGMEFEFMDLSEIKRRVDGGSAIWEEEGILDGESHERRGELREDGAIDELDHGVNDALRVNDDLNLIWG